MNHLIRILILLTTGTSFAVQSQNVRLVHPLGDDGGNTCISTPCRTIGRAVEVAVSGDIVDIAAGEYTEALTIDKSLTLRGAGQDNITMIDGDSPALGRVITISGGDLEVEITDLVIRNGSPFVGLVGRGTAGNGGGVHVEGSALTLSNVTFSNNIGINGGGLYGRHSDLALTNVSFEGNRAVGEGDTGGHGGGLYVSDSSVVLTGTVFSGNQATGPAPQTLEFPALGAGMFTMRGTAEFDNSSFVANEATRGSGGGLYSIKTPVILDTVEFSENAATRQTGDPSLGGQGGGMAHGGIDSPTLTSVDFIGNSAQGEGGGIRNSGENSMALADVAFEGNNARRGGGMSNRAGTPLLESVTFNGNQAFSGGGMHNEEGSAPVLNQVTFSSNMADNGGGMNNLDGSAPLLINVEFRGNRASCPPDQVCLIGIRRDGGGMWNQNSDPVLVNVTFSGNLATDGKGGSAGGGMYNQESAPRLTNVTFSGNRAAGTGGGMFNVNDTSPVDVPVIRNTIFWNNMDGTGTGTAGASIATGGAAPTPNIQFSLVQGAFPSGNGNLDGTNPDNDPRFLNTPDPESAPTLAGNLRLRPESPVIDSGNNTFVDGIDTDLGGNPRIIGTAVDLGPYEFTGEIDDMIFRDRFEAP